MMRILHASAYIVWCSAKNRMRLRLRRLREPRYLLGAIAGLAYLYFTVWARLGIRRPRRRSVATGPFSADATAAVQAMAASMGGVGLLLMAALAWVFSPASGLLAFTQPEVQLLFPAPVSRRQLLFYRLMRSQLGLLFAALIPSFLITNPSLQAGTGPTRLLRALALWVLFVTIRVYIAAVALGRARLASGDESSRRTAWLPLAAIVLAATTVAVPLLQQVVGGPRLVSFSDFMARVVGVAGRGWPRVALWPFVSLIRPLFAAWPWPYLSALAGAIVVMIATILWLLQSDAAFEAAAESVGQRFAARRQAGQVWTSRDFGFSLNLSGGTEALFLWKNAMQTLRGTNLAQVMRFLIPLTMLAVIGTTARMSSAQARGPAAGLATGSIAIAAFFTVLGPLAVQSDLRGDLQHLELLKTWPLRAAAVIRGELLWPTLLMTLSAWLPLVCAAILSAAAFPAWPLTTRVSVALAAMMVTPAVIASQFMVHAAAALLFPAWVATGRNRPRGFEAMGQRLIMFGAVIFSLTIVVGPGAIAGGIVAYAFYRAIGMIGVVMGAVVCSAIVAVEIMALTEMLAGRFDRIDVSQVEKPD